MIFYTGKIFPAWQNSLFIGGLGSTNLVRLSVKGDQIVGEERLLQDLQPNRERFRDVRQGPDGAIYLADGQPEGPHPQAGPEGLGQTHDGGGTTRSPARSLNPRFTRRGSSGSAATCAQRVGRRALRRSLHVQITDERSGP